MKTPVLAGLIVLGLGAGASLWRNAEIQPEAWVQEQLVQIAWARARNGESGAKPWPWMESVPVAEISIPRLNQNFIVMRGTSGPVLAVAPGWNERTDAPGSAGISLVTGHSHTHFDFLRELRVGDTINVATAGGSREYLVEELKIVIEPEIRITQDGQDSVLLLATWLPFANWQPEGARLVAVARAPGQDPTS